MGKWALFVKATRIRVIPVMISPVLIGTAGAFAWNGVFQLGWCLLTLLGAVSLHLFSNMVNDLWDYRNGADTAAARSEGGAIGTHSGLLAGGVVSERSFALWTWFMLLLACICGAILTFARGPMIVVYGVIGALIAYFYVAPPVRFGYRGKGFSEVAIVVAFGVLPVLGSYYVQTLAFDYRALLASLPIGMLTTLILFNHHFLHWQADKLAGKRTLVVVLGERKALVISRGILAAAFVTLLLAVSWRAMPIYSLIAIAFVIPLRKVFSKLGGQNPPQAYLPLMASSLKLAMRCGLIFAASLVAQGIWGY